MEPKIERARRKKKSKLSERTATTTYSYYVQQATKLGTKHGVLHIPTTLRSALLHEAMRTQPNPSSASRSFFFGFSLENDSLSEAFVLGSPRRSVARQLASHRHIGQGRSESRLGSVEFQPLLHPSPVLPLHFCSSLPPNDFRPSCSVRDRCFGIISGCWMEVEARKGKEEKKNTTILVVGLRRTIIASWTHTCSKLKSEMCAH